MTSRVGGRPGAELAGRPWPARSIWPTTLLYWLGVVAVLTVLRRPFNGVISRFVTLESEYGIVEQASRFLLIGALLLIAFTFFPPIDRTPSFGPPLFGLTFVLLIAESDFTSEGILGRPLLVAVFGLWTLAALLRRRQIVAVVLLGASFAVLATGALLDFLVEHPDSGGPLRTLAESTGLDTLNEEHFDLVGIGGLAFVVLLLLGPSPFLSRTWSTDRWRAIVGLVALGVLTVGNSLLHWRYEPSGTLRLVGSVIALVGLAGLAWGVAGWLEAINRRSHRGFLALIVGSVAYFVVAPNAYWGVGNLITLGFWFPLILAGTVLWVRALPEPVDG